MPRSRQNFFCASAMTDDSSTFAAACGVCRRIFFDASLDFVRFLATMAGFFIWMHSLLFVAGRFLVAFVSDGIVEVTADERLRFTQVP